MTRVILAAMIVLLCPSFGQTPGVPRFEVASVKPSADIGSARTSWSPRGINAKNVPLRNLIEMAYQIRDFRSQVDLSGSFPKSTTSLLNRRLWTGRATNSRMNGHWPKCI